MSKSEYDKGFGGPRRKSPAAQHRSGGEIASRREGGASAHGMATIAHTFEERGPAAVAAIQPAADAAPKRWADHTNRVGSACAAIGLLYGLFSLVRTGNWFAPVVLAVMCGLSGWIIYFLLSIVLDAFSRRR